MLYDQIHIKQKKNTVTLKLLMKNKSVTPTNEFENCAREYFANM